MKKNNNQNESPYHTSVMLKEVLEALHIKKLGKYIDATLGTAGYSMAIEKKGGIVLGIEKDPKILSIAKRRYPDGNFVLGDFANIDKIAQEFGFKGVDGIVFDLGISNLHFKKDNRGFSFEDPNQELDMRLDPNSQGVKASDLLNVLDKRQLINLFTVTMKCTDAKKLAQEIVRKRPIKLVSDLLPVIGSSSKPKLHPATLAMLALRIAVNEELSNLNIALPKAMSLLKKEGCLVVVTFHSGEAKVVEKFMGKGIYPLLPSEEEKINNPRSRSAKLWKIIKK